MTATVQSVLGATSCSVLATALFLKLLEIVTRHGILLTGQCVDRLDERGAAGRSALPVYGYRIRLQNLESVAAEQPFTVEIKASTTRPLSEPEKARAVLVLAGWKPYTVQSARPSSHDNEFIWRAVFPFLPPYDTWSFEVVLPSDCLKLSLVPDGVRKRRYIVPTFAQYFEPDTIVVSPRDSREPRISGPVVFPRPVLALVLSLLSISLHMLFAGKHGWTWSSEYWGWEDAGFVAGEILFIWTGYIVMRRRVYPVIQGYRFATPPACPGTSDQERCS